MFRIRKFSLKIRLRGSVYLNYGPGRIRSRILCGNENSSLWNSNTVGSDSFCLNFLLFLTNKKLKYLIFFWNFLEFFIK